jgi:hypothetical protein
MDESVIERVVELMEAEGYDVTVEEDNGGAPPVRIDGEEVVRDERIVITARKTTRAPLPV